MFLKAKHCTVTRIATPPKEVETNASAGPPEVCCIKLRSRKSAPMHPRARIHSHATLRPRARSRGSTPAGAARVVRPWLIEFRANL